MTDTQARFTHLFERFAIDVLSACSNKTQAEKLLGLSWDEVHHIQSRAVKRGMDRRSVEEVKHVGIDEKSFRKGQSYVSLLYDLNASRVLEVVADRTTESATTLLSTLPEQRRNEVTAVAVMTAVGTTRTSLLFTTSFISSVILQQWLTKSGAKKIKH